MDKIPHLAAVAALMASGTSVLAAGKLACADKSLLKNVAEANVAEVESCKLAVGKSANTGIRKFAQLMADDHSNGLTDDAKHKAVMVEFKTLSDGLFDNRYVKQAGAGDHEVTERLLKKTPLRQRVGTPQGLSWVSLRRSPEPSSCWPSTAWSENEHDHH